MNIDDFTFPYQLVEPVLDYIVALQKNISQLILKRYGLKFSGSNPFYDMHDRRRPADVPPDIEDIPRSADGDESTGNHQRHPPHIYYQSAVSNDS
ncbi:MAG: hypothetical protein ACYTGS_18240, partial [Planctomycetota bacterium]